MTDEVDKINTDSTSESENPAIPSPKQHTSGRPQSNRDWWPNQVDLSVLNKPSRDSDPLGEDFDYRAEVFYWGRCRSCVTAPATTSAPDRDAPERGTQWQ